MLRIQTNVLLVQGCHGTGRTGNLKVHFSRQGKHMEIANKCNVGAFNVPFSILGFRVVCATCGRQVQHPEFRLARSK